MVKLPVRQQFAVTYYNLHSTNRKFNNTKCRINYTLMRHLVPASQENQEGIQMNVPNNLTSIISVLSIFLSIAGLVISPASSTMLNAPPNEMSGAVAQGIGHHGIFNASSQTELLQTMITKLGAQGVDVRQAQADLASGNLTSARQWVMAYTKDHPGIMGNATRPRAWNKTLSAERIQSLLTNLSKRGINVSQAQADLAAGNTSAALHSLQAFPKDRSGVPVNSTRPRVWNSSFEAEQLQTMITKLGQQGVDVSQAQADLVAGDTNAATKWLMAYYQDHPGTAVKIGRHYGNSTEGQAGDTRITGHHPDAGGQSSGILKETISHLFHWLSGTGK
jgi:hypothetical protein